MKNTYKSNTDQNNCRAELKAIHTEQNSRRDFLRRSSLTAIGIGSIASQTGLSMNSLKAADPHFVLHVHYSGGWDPSYLFDARHRKLTQYGWIQNYHATSDSATPWTGSNGGKALVSPSAASLLNYKDYFSVINGVMMGRGIDGHIQVENILLSSSDSGRLPYFAGNFNAAGVDPVNYLNLGQGFFIPANVFSEGLGLTPGSLEGFKKAAQNVALNSHLGTNLQQTTLNSAVAGIPSSGVVKPYFKRYSEKFAAAHSLASKLISAEIPEDIPEESDFRKSIKTSLALFKTNVTSAAIIHSFDKNIDTHGSTDASQQPQTYQEISGEIEFLINQLRDTPYDSTRNFWDVTTFIITSEFSRTMRQDYISIDSSGTDHNPLCNSVIIGGKGVHCGQIVGASDLTEVDSTGKLKGVSPYHTYWDPDLLKVMGKPFDFASGMPYESSGKDVPLENLLSIHSVVNTLFNIKGVDPSNNWKVSPQASAPLAPVISTLIKS